MPAASDSEGEIRKKKADKESVEDSEGQENGEAEEDDEVFEIEAILDAKRGAFPQVCSARLISCKFHCISGQDGLFCEMERLC